MRISISQPTLFPWIGYFDIIKQSDIFVFFDNVKFEKRSWQMRNRIKSINQEKEEAVWIRIPTTISISDTLIKDVKIDNTQDWKKKHINSFNAHYGKEFETIDFLKKLYEKEWEKIVDFNIEFIKLCCNYLDIHTRLVRASEFNVKGKKSHLLLDICKQFDTTEYLTSLGAYEYLEKDKQIFDQENIKIKYHNFIHPTYKQRGKKFIEKLSIIDLLFNEKENSRERFNY